MYALKKDYFFHGNLLVEMKLMAFAEATLRMYLFLPNKSYIEMNYTGYSHNLLLILS